MSDIAGNPPAINQHEKIERLFWEAETALLDIEEIINGSEGCSELVVYQNNKEYIEQISTVINLIAKKAKDQISQLHCGV
tara:strand:- start:102 stop:341 length:240 start_codon:yes stop_codon:yes gene_type:complete